MTTANWLRQILDELEEVRCPELRLGQLIATIGMLAEDETGLSLWDVEDADFAVALARFTADMARRDSGTAEPGAAPDRGGMWRFPEGMLSLYEARSRPRWPRTRVSDSPIDARRTTSAMSSSGVSVRLMITRRAPFCFA